MPWAHYPDTKLQEHVSNRNGGKEIQRGREGKGTITLLSTASFIPLLVCSPKAETKNDKTTGAIHRRSL